MILIRSDIYKLFLTHQIIAIFWSYFGTLSLKKCWRSYKIPFLNINFRFFGRKVKSWVLLKHSWHKTQHWRSPRTRTKSDHFCRLKMFKDVNISSLTDFFKFSTACFIHLFKKLWCTGTGWIYCRKNPFC